MNETNSVLYQRKLASLACRCATSADTENARFGVAIRFCQQQDVTFVSTYVLFSALPVPILS